MSNLQESELYEEVIRYHGLLERCLEVLEVVYDPLGYSGEDEQIEKLLEELREEL